LLQGRCSDVLLAFFQGTAAAAVVVGPTSRIACKINKKYHHILKFLVFSTGISSKV
jgi:hypothetical protein